MDGANAPITDTLRIECLTVFPNIVFPSMDCWVLNDASNKGPFSELREAIDAAIENMRSDRDACQYYLSNDGSLGVSHERAIAFLAELGHDPGSFTKAPDAAI